MAKGTYTTTSDIDLIISTPGRNVTHADKQRVVEHLRKQNALFHLSHVRLKKLAIECIVLGQHVVDLVFADTAEYGQLPR
jgi:predicted nucleotidyltransferase